MTESSEAFVLNTINVGKIKSKDFKLDRAISLVQYAFLILGTIETYLLAEKTAEKLSKRPPEEKYRYFSKAVKNECERKRIIKEGIIT